MKIEIYRYDTYINEVDSREKLRQWLLSNVSIDGDFIPLESNVEQCMEMAKDRGYSFKVEKGFDRLGRILEVAKIEEVAMKFVKLKKRGENFIFDCPFCHGHATGYISPKFQIFKCFVCGRTGNVINFLMELKDFTFVEAEKYLEKFYNIV